MRKPKWTYEQMLAHYRWCMTGRNILEESPEDQEEYEFCEAFYAQDPGVRRIEDRALAEASARQRQLISECHAIAMTTLQSGEQAILRSLRDPSQHDWINFFIVQAGEHSRPIVEYVLREADPWLRWPLIRNAATQRRDLERVAADNECCEFIRSEAREALEERLSDSTH